MTRISLFKGLRGATCALGLLTVSWFCLQAQTIEQYTPELPKPKGHSAQSAAEKPAAKAEKAEEKAATTAPLPAVKEALEVEAPKRNAPKAEVKQVADKPAAMPASKPAMPAARPAAMNKERPAAKPSANATAKKKKRKKRRGPTITDNLQGIILVSKPEDVQSKGASASGLKVASELSLLEREDFRLKMDEFLGKPFAMRDMIKLQREIIFFYRRNLQPYVNVVVPEQDVQGTIQLIVQEGKLSEVYVEGNEFFSEQMLLDYVDMPIGESVDGFKLQQTHRWLNANPFRTVSVMMAAGDNPGETKLALKVYDKRPWRIYGAYENSGNTLTGQDRWITGFLWGDAFNRDIVMSYQYTRARDIDFLSAHSLSLSKVLPWSHQMTVFGSFAETGAAVAAPANIDGESWQLSARYTIPMRPVWKNKIKHDIVLGADIKNTNNNVLFNSASVSDTTSEIIQALLTYNASMFDKRGYTALTLDLAFGPGGLTNQNEQENFDAFRTSANKRYVYLRGQLDRVTRLPKKWKLLTKLVGQISSTNLLPSEQLGLGGYASIRGYDEREASGDNAWYMSNEIHLPAFKPLTEKWVGRSEFLDNLLEDVGDESFDAFVFWDYGVSTSKFLSSGEDEHVILSSVGPGFTYSLGTYLSARFDFGWQLKDSGRSLSGENKRANFRISISY